MPPAALAFYRLPLHRSFAAANTDVSLFVIDNLLLGKLNEKTALPGAENKPLLGPSGMPYTAKAS